MSRWLEVYVFSLQFSNIERYIWKTQPDLISTDNLILLSIV